MGMRDFVAVSKWDRCLSLLQVPPSHQEDGMPLKRWLERQRRIGKKGLLDPERMQKLKVLGIHIEQVARFDNWIELLRKFSAREGHCDVPSKHEERGKKLGA